jgi:hypothetical protein
MCPGLPQLWQDCVLVVRAPWAEGGWRGALIRAIARGASMCGTKTDHNASWLWALSSLTATCPTRATVQSLESVPVAYSWRRTSSPSDTGLIAWISLNTAVCSWTANANFNVCMRCTKLAIVSSGSMANVPNSFTRLGDLIGYSSFIVTQNLSTGLSNSSLSTCAAGACSSTCPTRAAASKASHLILA